MDITKMLADLRTEREAIEQAIMVLERLTLGGRKRRGRSRKWMSEARTTAAPTDGRKHVRSPEVRARMAEAQRKRWAKKKKAEA